MTRKLTLLSATCAAALLALPAAGIAASQDTEPTKQMDQAPAAEEPGVGDRLGKAWEDFKAYTKDEREAAAQAGEDMLRAMDEQIDEWTESDEAEKADVDEMKELRGDVARKLDEADRNDEESWTEKSWNDFKQGVGDTVREFENLAENEEARDELATDVENAWDDFTAYTAEQKDAAVKAGDDLLKAMDRRIDLWTESDEAENSEAEKKEEKIAEMRAIRDDIANRLETAEGGSADDWDEDAWTRFKDTVGDAVDSFQSYFEEDGTSASDRGAGTGSTE